MVDAEATIYAEKQGDYELSPEDEMENIKYYNGHENQLHMQRFYNQRQFSILILLETFINFYLMFRFLCDYELQWYPFDIQRCSMIMEVTKTASPLIKLISKDLEYLGKKFLTQYEVLGTVMDTQAVGKTQQLIVEITLGRQLLGTILNVFIPTIVLNLISYTTNFYKDDFFETVIAINLTTMLVIVTLFVSVSENLPPTSYMKMMDIWLLFNLFVPFLLILIHTYMENLRE